MRILTTLAFVSLALFTAACGTTIPMYYPSSLQLTSAQRDQCILAYKVQMNDPSSFQLVTQPEYDRQASEFSSKISGISKAVYVATIRGRNRMGGLVLGHMSCDYFIGPNGVGALAMAMSFR